MPGFTVYREWIIRTAIANKKGGKAQPNKGKGNKKRGPQKFVSRMSKAVGAARSSVAETLRLTPCAAKYAIAIVDPWDKNAMGACVPSVPSRPSRKVHGYIRGTATVGAGGVGWVLVAPTLANDAPTLWYTSSGTTYSSGNSTITPYAAGVLIPGVSIGYAANLPYRTSQLCIEDGTYATVPVVGRMVSASLTVQYTGTELDRSGLITCFSHPTHENLCGATFTDFDSRGEAIIEPASRKKCRVTTCAVNSEETSYQDFFPLEATTADYIRMAYPFSMQNIIQTFGATGVGAAPMAVKFTGVPGATYYFEYITHCEYIGILADVDATHNDVDTVGLALVQSAYANLASAKQSHPEKTLGALMKKELFEAAKKYGPAALKVGGQMILSALT